MKVHEGICKSMCHMDDDTDVFFLIRFDPFGRVFGVQFVFSSSKGVAGTRWWFQISFIFTPTWGNDPIWRAYFSNGLKPPTREALGFVFCFLDLALFDQVVNNHGDHKSPKDGVIPLPSKWPFYGL